MKKVILTKLLIVIHVSFLFSQIGRSSFNDGWLFQSNLNGGDEEMTQVSLPHHWNKDAYETHRYQRGKARYTKHFFVTEEQLEKEIYLHFEGVNSDAEITLNGQKVMRHAGGYTAFSAYLSPYLLKGVANQLDVEVDNRNENLAPLSGDFTIFGGIYRPIWWVEKEKVSFAMDSLGGDGLQFDITQVSRNKAKGELQLTINNSLSEASSIEIHYRMLNPQGKVVMDRSMSKKLQKNLNKIKVELPTVDKPQLWTPDTPSLYTLQVSLQDKNKQVVDQIETQVGWRWIEIGDNNALLLNGEPIKLIGASRHQDRVGYGIALSDEQHEEDVRLLKQTGANFIRLGHYPQSDVVLRACDRLGLLVWEEIPVVDLVNENAQFANNAKRQLREMVHQHRNHPSVVMWGYMNEAIIQVPHRIKDPQARAKRYAATVSLAKELEKICKEIDPSRLTVMAYHGTELYNEVGLAGIADISGWNLYEGWYGGGLSGFENFVSKQHRLYPRRPLIVSEFGAGSDKRIHSFKPRKFDFSVEYQQTFMEHYWPIIQDSTFLMGGAMWNFIDFSSALRQESMPHINNKGVLYGNREKKDVYFYHEAFFQKKRPVVHLALRDWQKRRLLDSDQKQPIKVYSNLEQVELFVGNQSYGVKPVDNCMAIWEIAIPEGKHYVRALGIQEGKMIEDIFPLDVTYQPRSLTEITRDNIDIHINAGSDAYFHTDASDRVYMPDVAYQEGSWGYLGGEDMTRGDRPGTTASIKGTTDDPLFQTQRQGDMSYRFDIPAGCYEVTLRFADLNDYGQPLAYDLGAAEKKESSRSSFDIYANGELIEKSFSPANIVGGNHALTRTYFIITHKPHLDLKFVPEKGTPFVNSLSIRAK